MSISPTDFGDNFRGGKPLTITVRVARQLSGLGHTTIYKLIKERKLKTATVGRRRLIDYSSLETLIKGL